MDWGKTLTVVGLVVGIAGAFVNDRTSVHIGMSDQGGGRIDVTDEQARRWVRWAPWGWRLIIAGAMCGLVGVFLQ
jgi:hypothetical protein